MKIKYIFLLGFIFYMNLWSYARDVEIKLEFMGVQNSTAYLGERFRVKVSITGSRQDISDPDVEGLNQLKVLGRSQATSISSYNSTFISEKSYIYDVVSDKEGSFKIGPAQLIYNNQTIKSIPEFLNLQVVKKKEGEATVDKSSSRSEGYEVFCKLDADNKDVFVGQPIVLNVRVYYRGNVAQLGMEPLKFPGFISKEIEDTAKGTENIDGKVYGVLLKKVLLLPVEAGKKEIDSVVINFNVLKRSRQSFFDDDFFAGLPAIFGENFEPKRTISNALQINVSDLPKCNNVVDGVGDFTSFNVTVDRTEATVNEPILLKLQIEGKGNLDQITTPKLDLPEGFRFYESKINVEQDLSLDFVGGKKSFEFVLQVNKIGKGRIPEQRFRYFDVNDKVYKTLKSRPIDLTVKAPLEGELGAKDSSLDEAAVIDTDMEYSQDIHFIEEENITTAGSSRNQKSLPLVVFFILLLLPFLYFLRGFFNTIICRFGLKKRKNFSVFRKELDRIAKEKNVKKLYGFFLSYLAVRLDVKLSLVNQDLIQDRLTKLGFEKDKLDQFINYLNECACSSFSNDLGLVDVENILDKSVYWLVYLNSGLRDKIL